MTEPLAPLARFAFDWADTLCDPEHGCAAYHRMWPLTRLLESGGALPAGGDFFARELAVHARDGKIHVLLSGGADTGVMAIALKAAMEHGLDLRITAVDRCRTPLEQMVLYGAMCRVPVQTIQCSLEDIPVGLNADVVVGHSILFFIAPDLRKAVFEAWANALRPGGAVLLSQRLGGSHTKQRNSRWTPEEVGTRRAELSSKLAASSDLPHLGRNDDILDAAEAFWTVPMPRNPVAHQDVMDLAVLSGMLIKAATPEYTDTSTSPFAFRTLSNVNARYEIVLEKPAA